MSIGGPVPVQATLTPSPVEVAISAFEHPELGTILTDGRGGALYLFTMDTRSNSNCSSGCVETWPPLVTLGEPAAGEGVDGIRLLSITREDGSLQVTYNGWPLYRFSGDEKPSDAKGQNVNNTWFVVSTAGGPIQNNAIVKTSEHPALGTILIEGSGRTVYLFAVDERNKSSCKGGCATAWPPLLTVGDPTGDEGVVSGLLGTTTRDDGSTQVTYNGWPLYYFAPDKKPGDTRGQNIGDIWFVVSTAGGPIQNNAVVKTSEHPVLGTILTEESGRTIYLFTEDENNKSNCTGDCATAWPPLLTVGSPAGDEGVVSGLLGTTTRDDGSTQVT